MQADAHEALAEARAVGSDAEVAGEREIAAAPGRGTVDAGDGRERQRHQTRDRPPAGGDQRRQAVERGALLLETHHEADVGAGAERAPRPGDDQHAHAGPRGDRIDRRGELLAHVVREGVQLLGTVEDQRGDTVGFGEQDLFGHGRDSR